MKFRKAITLIAVVCAVLLAGSTAMAANNVTANVTSESIQLDSICSKAGGFSLRFDKGTQLLVGDRIEAKLPLGVTICTKGGFDLELSKGNSNGFLPGDVAGLLQDGDPTPVFFTEDPVASAAGFISGTVYFRITGSEGGQFIFLDVVGDAGSFVQVGPDAGDTFTILFFDQKTNPVEYNGTPPGIYVDDTTLAGKQYTVDASVAQNTLCINVADPIFTATVVNASMDSKEDKFTFVPSNPQIADIVNPQTIAQYICKGDTPPYIILNEREEQDDCDSTFDADERDRIRTCSGDGFDVILRNATTPFALEDYAIDLEILVNGNTGSHGVFWAATDLGVEGHLDGLSACDGSNDVAPKLDKVLDSAGNVVTDALGSDNSCDVKAKAVKLSYAPSDLGLGTNQSAIYFNIPRMAYDLDDVNEGDVVTVRITLSLPPCKIIGVVDVKWATLGCPRDSETSSTLLFPYYTALQGADWWNGMAISNIGSNDGTFTATVYEADGDVGTYTSPVVLAKRQWVALLSGVVFTKTAGSGTLGDSTCFIMVKANFSSDGFAMISNLVDSAVDGSESMGYLPRESGYFKGN